LDGWIDGWMNRVSERKRRKNRGEEGMANKGE
jgi:hypothetical protein